MLWLFSTLILLAIAIRFNVRRTEKLESTLVDTAIKSVENASILVKQLERVISLLEEKHK